MFELIFAIASIAGGAIASIAGFGIGSILTPVLAASVGMRLAVAAVSIPHAAGTVARFTLIWRKINVRVLAGFGITSIIGGLSGALLHTRFSSVVLSYILGSALIIAGGSNMLGLATTLRFKRNVAPIAGLFSGLLGGLVGNQGGIRSAALLGFELEKEAFIATNTATGLAVDLARMPVYLSTEWNQIVSIYPLILIGIAGVLLGTFGGKRVLERIPEKIFRRIVGILIFILGVVMIIYPQQ